DQVNGLSRERERLAGEAGERTAALTTLETQVATLTDQLGQARTAQSLAEQALTAARTSQSVADKRNEELAAKLAALERNAGAEATAAAAKIAAATAAAEARA